MREMRLTDEQLISFPLMRHVGRVPGDAAQDRENE